MKRQLSFRLCAWATAIALASLSTTTGAAITRGVAGTDYLQTGPPSQVIILGTPVALQRVPISTARYGSTDTIVVRPADAIFSGKKATASIQVGALSMQGTYKGCTVSVTGDR
jgi:hypothetical protein